MKLEKNIIILFGLLLSALACTDTIEPDVDVLGLSYFPLRTGHFVEYRVKEISYNSINDADTVVYMLHEAVVDSFYTQAGQLRYVVHVFKREPDEEAWQMQQVIQRYVDNNVAVSINGNNPVIKLSLPVREGISWDMNRLNTLNEDLVSYDSVANMYISENGNSFEDTATIVQGNNQDLIVQRDLRYEIFAKEVGLIRQVIVRLNYCIEADCFGQQVVEDGYIRYKEYERHGFE